jgi:cytochrome c
MLNAAVQHYQEAGREQALKDFTAKKAPFGDRDLYVVCLGADHKMTANGAYPMLVGLSADSIDDSEGRPLGQAVWDVVSAQPQGSMPFHWKNPLSGQEESKILFYQKLDQDVCGVAADQQ